MREKWIVETKKADFAMLSEKLEVSPLVVRCMVNRGIETEEAMQKYLRGTLEDLYHPLSMKDMEKAVEIVKQERQKGSKIAIASDFDCDGIFSGYILWLGFRKLGFDCRIFTPARVEEGYGLNERIIEEALAEDRTFLVTCDNGIAALPEISYAKEKGMTVIVTDHHEVQEAIPEADAVLDPKQSEETYPFDGLCGGGVAFKFICALYDAFSIPEAKKKELLEYTAIATVADVMELKDENRILVKYGLEALEKTDNVGLCALLEVQGLAGKKINAGHIGFVLGPCFNAAGRISTVEKSFALLMETDYEKALLKAEELKAINVERKSMTEQGTKQAFEQLEGAKIPAVIGILLPDVHESLVGIIAGRIKEHYNHPVIVFTRVEDGLVKGSGRSIEAYHMFEELLKCNDLMVRFGGHKMAAGMTLKEADLPELLRRLNENAALTEEDFRPIVKIDAPMPVGYVSEKLIEEFEQMEPYGVGNPKPLFAEQHFLVRRGRRLGKEKNVLKLNVINEKGNACDAIYFGNIDKFEDFIRTEWGEDELKRMYEGRENHLDIAFTYMPTINEYQGMRSVQIQIVNYCHVERG